MKDIKNLLLLLLGFKLDRGLILPGTSCIADKNVWLVITHSVDKRSISVRCQAKSLLAGFSVARNRDRLRGVQDGQSTPARTTYNLKTSAICIVLSIFGQAGALIDNRHSSSSLAHGFNMHRGGSMLMTPMATAIDWRQVSDTLFKWYEAAHVQEQAALPVRM